MTIGADLRLGLLGVAEIDRSLVHWCFLVDTVHTAGTLWMIWVYAVDNFANVNYLATTLWPVSAAPLFAGVSILRVVLPI